MRYAKSHIPALLLILLIHPTGAVAQPAPRLPVEAFLPSTKFVPPVFSADGRHIAMVFPEGETLVVAVRAVERAKIEPIGRISEPDVYPRWIRWAGPRRLLVSAEVGAPGTRAPSHRVFAFDLGVETVGSGGTVEPQPGQEEWNLPLQDEVMHWQRDNPMHALVQYRDPGQAYPSVKLMDVLSGDLTSILPSRPGILVWFADHDGVVRAGVGFEGNRYTLFARIDARAAFEKIQDFNPLRESGFRFAGFGFDPAILYVWKLLEGRSALYEYNLTSKHVVQLVFAHPDVDVHGLVFNEGRRKLIAVDYIDDEPKRWFLDEDARREQEMIDDVLPGTFNELITLSRDHTRAIVRATGDTQPPAYYLFVRNGDSKGVEPLIGVYPALPKEQLAPMRVVSYRTRDGLEIPAYLTVPKGAEPKNLPVIVLPHGGPATRDYRRFDPEVQLLANRGFAVLQMNFRGSGGYGERYCREGFHQWGLAMQDDITDGVRWLIEQGIADPGRIGIFGASYGGYAALEGLVKTPELYRAGASYAGVTSLPLFAADNHGMVGGEGWTDPKQLHENSPIDHVTQIRAPVFLAHGADDERVPVKHSQMMVKALRQAGKDVEYLEFPREHHGFLFKEDRRILYERLATFFEKHLALRPQAHNGDEVTRTRQ